tara:strand:+ start:387 stop:674 length:288 start_codon:yes stop_codon:yes gene_type:complete
MNLTEAITKSLPKDLKFKVYENQNKSGLNIKYNLEPDSYVILQESQLKVLSSYCQENGLFISLFINSNDSKQMISINKSKPRVAESENSVNSYFG